MKSRIYVLFALSLIVNPAIYSMDEKQKKLDKEFISKAMSIIIAFDHNRIYSAIDPDLTVEKYKGYVADTIKNKTIQLHTTDDYGYVICKGDQEKFSYFDNQFAIEGLFQPYFSVFKKNTTDSQAEALCYVTFTTKKEKSLEAALFATSLQTLRDSEQVKTHTEFFKLFEETLKKDGIKKIFIYASAFTSSRFYAEQGYIGNRCVKNLEDKKS